jgi:hypothetical protein
VARGALAGAAPADLFVGVYAFTPESPDEIPLRVGGVVRVLSRTEDGWWKGRDAATGKEGLFPFNRTRMLTRDEAAKYLAAAAAAAVPAFAAAPAQAAAAAAKPPVAASAAPALAAAGAAKPAAQPAQLAAPVPAAAAKAAPAPAPLSPSAFAFDASPPKAGPAAAATAAAVVDPFAFDATPAADSAFEASEFDVFSR